MERDKIIEQLTDSVKQSLLIREQLHEQSERLTKEISQLRKQYADTIDNFNESNRKANWLAGSNEVDGTGQRLSEITIDLVSESEFDEDDDGNNEFYGKKSPVVELADEDEKIQDKSDHAMETGPPEKTIEEFKRKLTADEFKIFTNIQDKFNEFLKQELEKAVKKQEQEIQTERNEKDTEISRLRQLLANIKSGSTEVKELRQELDAIHKKEMEDLRMYFERKCSDLEKQ